jgi:small subunit ribosomal protein S13
VRTQSTNNAKGSFLYHPLSFFIFFVMPRIAGVNVPGAKHIDISLSYIYGIGRPMGRSLCTILGIDHTRKMDDLSEVELDQIRDEIKKHVVEGDLRREVMYNIKRLQEINSYRGSRHKKRLPVRGQRTHTNARTRKGKAVAVAGKKKVAK